VNINTKEYWDASPEDALKRHGLVSRIDLIRLIASSMSSPRMLEIGVDQGDVLNCCHDVLGSYLGVDIDTSHTKIPDGCKIDCAYIQNDSLQFWKELQPDRQFDIIFVDGCHEEKHSYIDISQAMLRLAPGGIVLAHDVNNENPEAQGTSVEWSHDRMKNLPGWYVRKIKNHGEGMGIYFRI